MALARYAFQVEIGLLSTLQEQQLCDRFHIVSLALTATPVARPERANEAAHSRLPLTVACAIELLQKALHTVACALARLFLLGSDNVATLRDDEAEPWDTPPAQRVSI